MRSSTHKNHDLTDLTVTTTAVGKPAMLNTTQHHPFWSVSRGEWIDAADLVLGELLHAADGKTTVVVARVRSFTGSRAMRDLTVNDTHVRSGILVTNHDDWPIADVVAAYRSHAPGCGAGFPTTDTCSRRPGR